MNKNSILLSISIILGLSYSCSKPIPEINYDLSVKNYKLAIESFNNKDFPALLSFMKKSNQYRPDHPGIMYNLALSYSLNGKSDSALTWLQRVADMGLSYPAKNDSDFITLWDNIKFQEIVTSFEKNLTPVNNSQPAFKINRKGLLTESIAFDPKSKTFFVGLINKREILSIDESGKTTIFADAEQGGLWSVFGMRVDTTENKLWVCTAAMEQTLACADSDLGKSALLRFDIKNGKPEKRYEIESANTEHLLGDLTVHHGCCVFVSDSKTNNIYNLPPNGDSLEIFKPGNNFVSLQGIDITPDGRYLFVADYSLGLFRISLTDDETTRILYPPNVCVLGIDGLYFYKNRLIAIQNGTNPHRVLSFEMNGKLNEIESQLVIEKNNPFFDEPTLGVIAEGSFFYIANSQWARFVNGEERSGLTESTEPVILKTTL